MFTHISNSQITNVNYGNEISKLFWDANYTKNIVIFLIIMEAFLYHTHSMIYNRIIKM